METLGNKQYEQSWICCVKCKESQKRLVIKISGQSHTAFALLIDFNQVEIIPNFKNIYAGTLV